MEQDDPMAQVKVVGDTVGENGSKILTERDISTRVRGVICTPLPQVGSFCRVSLCSTRPTKLDVILQAYVEALYPSAAKQLQSHPKCI